jgi:hypothetical protein
MERQFRVGDQVLFRGEVYTITRKRLGLDFYEIAKIHSHNGQQFLTCINDGLYASSLKLVTESTIENARDIQEEEKATRGEED